MRHGLLRSRSPRRAMTTILQPENSGSDPEEQVLRGSDAFFADVFWSTPDCVALVRAVDGTILKANRSLCQLWKTTPKDVIGKTFAHFSSWLHEDERLDFKRRLESDGECLGFEATLRMMDGRDVVFELSARILTLNQESCILNIRRDVTEVRRIERALKTSEVRYRRLFESAKDGILILDPKTGEVVDANPYLVDLLGYSHEELIGKVLWDFGLVEDAEANEKKFTELSGKACARYDDLPLKTRDGHRIDVELVSNVYPVDGEDVIQCNVRDVTAQRTAERDVALLNATLEQRVLERTAQLEAANRELEAFSYSVSHDLRTPLRAIDGYSQAVLEDYGPQLSGDGERYLQTIRAGAQQMGTLIDDLLKFSRLGREAINKRTFSTANLVQSALEGLADTHENRHVELRIADLPASHGDPALLKQVWVNLLSNALKYTRCRETAIIEVGSHPENGGTAFFVRDNGAGFNMRYVDKLFGVFQRLHRAEDYEGTGVGLAICQRIIHRHGGRIRAESEVDHGATFTFTIQGGQSDE